MRFLPLAASWWICLGRTEAPVELPVPEGMPIYSAVSGRVVAVDDVAVGEVVIRSNELRYHYRRLRASGLQLAMGDEIAAGTPLGEVAAAADGSNPVLIFGVQNADGAWLDPFTHLVGAQDPSALRHCVPPPAEPPAPVSVSATLDAQGATDDLDVLVAPRHRRPPNSAGRTAARPPGGHEASQPAAPAAAEQPPAAETTDDASDEAVRRLVARRRRRSR